LRFVAVENLKKIRALPLHAGRRAEAVALEI
jgi:hypothetical protein